MTVKEMHIDVRDQVQRMGGNRTRKLQDDNIDWCLNRTTQMMLESAVEPVLGSGRYRIKPGKHGIVSGLIVNRKSLSAAWLGDKYVTILPPDMWYLLDDGSKVSQLCTGDTKITGYEVLNVTRVPFPMSGLTENFYSNVELMYNNVSIFNLSTLLQQRQKTWGGMGSNEAHFYIRELLQQELLRLGIQVYWENFYNFQYPWHLIFVSTSATVPISLIVDGQEYTEINEELTTEIHSTARASVTSPNTMISSDKDIASTATPYFKTSYISPLSELGKGVIYTHRDMSYIVYHTTINYVRKPAVISLSLGTNCQLSENVHQQLCNQTAAMVLNRIADEQWKPVTEQNAIITQ